MKIAMCHYSYHRTVAEQEWSFRRYVEEVEKLGIDGVDLHVRYCGDPAATAGRVREAMAGTSLELAGLSLSTNFFIEDPAAFDAHVEETRGWIRVAGELNAGTSRIFGAHIPADQRTPEVIAKVESMVVRAIERLIGEAEDSQIVLALENHGGFPGTGEEQVRAIEAIDSPYLRATVDVGNYMSVGQSGVEGTRIAAPYCGYVHFKDFVWTDGGSGIRATVIGEGEVDLPACVSELKRAGYDGFIAIEYEAEEAELTAIPKSVRCAKEVLSGL